MPIFLALAFLSFVLFLVWGPALAASLPQPQEILRGALELMTLYVGASLIAGRVRWTFVRDFLFSFAGVLLGSAVLDRVNATGFPYLAAETALAGAAFAVITLFNPRLGGRGRPAPAAIGDTRTEEEVRREVAGLPAADPRRLVVEGLDVIERAMAAEDAALGDLLLGLEQRLVAAGRFEAARWTAKQLLRHPDERIATEAQRRTTLLEQCWDEDRGHPDFVGSQRLIHILDQTLHPSPDEEA